MDRKLSDAIVSPRTILNCVLQMQQHGTKSTMQRLEQTEPDLAEYLLESLSNVYQELQRLHADSQKTRRVYRQFVLVSLVCIEALRQSHSQLWQDQMDDSA